MNTLHDKTLDCRNIGFAVRRRRDRLEVLSLPGPPTKNGASRIAIRGVAETFRKLGCSTVTAQRGEAQTYGRFARLWQLPGPVDEDATQDALLFPRNGSFP